MYNEYELMPDVIERLCQLVDKTGEDSDRIMAHSSKAILLSRTHRHNEAITEYNKVLEYDIGENNGITRAVSLSALAELYTLVGNIEGMRNAHEEITKLYNQSTPTEFLFPIAQNYNAHLFELYKTRIDQELEFSEIDEARKIVSLASHLSREERDFRVRYEQTFALQVMLSKIDHAAENEEMYHMHLNSFTASMIPSYKYNGAGAQYRSIHPSAYNRYYEKFGDVEAKHGHFDISKRIYERLLKNLTEAYEFELNAPSKLPINVNTKIAASRAAKIHIKLGNIIETNGNPFTAQAHFKSALVLYEKHDYPDSANEVRERIF